MGLQIHANTPATSVARAADGTWQVTTPRGTVVAKEVVLATNGYTTALDPRFQGVVVPIHGDSFIYRNGFEYMVSRRAEDGGDIIIGGGLYENGDGGVGRGWKHRRHRDERSDQLVSQGNNSEIFRDQLGRKAPRRTSQQRMDRHHGIQRRWLSARGQDAKQPFTRCIGMLQLPRPRHGLVLDVCQSSGRDDSGKG
ncbi:hypothetical protein MCOR03_006567 [Pyricularia oryzae]|nr:hypothetical protein MCOR18_005175 [Pyricularia oryzae]KAI6555948.1 hypothetical protein MCOR03_006567 [Pyricularia oryzae]